MTDVTDVKRTDDVPAQVFESFLRALTEAAISEELIARLRKTLLQDKTFNERALKEAIFAEDPPT